MLYKLNSGPTNIASEPNKMNDKSNSHLYTQIHTHTTEKEQSGKRKSQHLSE